MVRSTEQERAMKPDAFNQWVQMLPKEQESTRKSVVGLFNYGQGNKHN